MYQIKNLLNNEPVVVAGAVLAVVQLLVVLHVFVLTAVALSALNTAIVAVLTLLTRSKVTPAP